MDKGLTKEVCEKNEPYYKNGQLFTLEECYSCVHDELFDDAEKFACPNDLQWEWHLSGIDNFEEKGGYKCTFIDCYMKEVEVKDLRHEPIQVFNDYLGRLTYGLMFYIGVNILCKEYLRRKPSYRLLGKYFLVGSVITHDVYM